ncbi:hypothetical protein SEA_AMORE2_1 [Gordonia phage Amore2]|nr:hypothetical protein SEA_AUSTIN_1 [Gordonia phage Austin]USH44817.1 hypothetical protein SEA_AMORE2_1 [Gordonia phage Amore2]
MSDAYSTIQILDSLKRVRNMLPPEKLERMPDVVKEYVATITKLELKYVETLALATEVEELTIQSNELYDKMQEQGLL